MREMRVFIAVELTESIKEELAQLQESLRGTGDKIKWVNSSLIHLTLKFLGEIREEGLKKVLQASREVAAKFSSFKIKIKGTGVFPDSPSPRVIWVGIEGGENNLETLARQLEEELARQGFAKERRKWVPHLTLGRVKVLKKKGKLRELVLKYKGIEGGEMEIRNISVIESRLTPKGPIYTLLERIPLIRRQR